VHIIDDIKKIKSGQKELREFGLTVGGVLFILGAIMAWRGRPLWPYFIGTGVTLALLGLTFYKLLIPLQKAWMAFAVVMGFVMSRVVLCIVFYGVVTPIGLIFRILGKDILDQRIDKERESYWIELPREVKTIDTYEKQF